jgi:cytochrome c biogenesis protein CcmG/thiol:disulfide interchange protein DsbE
VAERVLAPCLEACASLLLPKSNATLTRGEVPGFALTDAAGNTVRLEDYRGKVVLLNFWATWCPPCLAEMPWFNEFQATYGSRGFAVIGISMDEDGWASVRPFLERTKIQYPVVIGDDDLAQRFGGVESLPYSLLIDRQGNIVSAHTGIVSKDIYEQEIVSLLNVQ